eukprot:366082-Chlamydomonas_euryale.AAC.40
MPHTWRSACGSGAVSIGAAGVDFPGSSIHFRTFRASAFSLAATYCCWCPTLPLSTHPSKQRPKDTPGAALAAQPPSPARRSLARQQQQPVGAPPPYTPLKKQGTKTHLAQRLRLNHRRRPGGALARQRQQPVGAPPYTPLKKQGTKTHLAQRLPLNHRRQPGGALARQRQQAVGAAAWASRRRRGGWSGRRCADAAEDEQHRVVLAMGGEHGWARARIVWEKVWARGKRRKATRAVGSGHGRTKNKGAA